MVHLVVSVRNNRRVLYATHARIDLDAISHNLRGIRSHVGERKVLVAVKANAYGHGAVVIAQHLERTRLADWLGVATVPEGLELRAAGVNLPILKLSHALPHEVDAAVRADLALTVVDAASIDAVAATGVAGAIVHLKVDTGMRRIGCEPEHAVELARRIDAAGLRLEGIFTHLPVSDSPDGVEFTQQQLARFGQLVDAVTAARGPVPLVHAANSGAILGHDLTGTNMVRPGVMAYGYYPDPECVRSIELRPAMEVRSRVSFVKQIRAGETVSYGRTWTAPSDRWIATVPVGYADGYSRALSNRGVMSIAGAAYPVAGRVCMDQTMLDLGPDPTPVRAGDEVVVMGEGALGVEETASLLGTIPYEVTCLITSRVTRTYHGGAA